jgi:hypothetical protein
MLAQRGGENRLPVLDVELMAARMNLDLPHRMHA